MPQEQVLTYGDAPHPDFLSLRGPLPEDVRKQTAEINQFVLFRLLVLLGTLGFVATSLSLVVPSTTAKLSDAPRFYFLESILILVTLGAIELDRKLSSSIRLYAAWLRIFRVSGWEYDVTFIQLVRAETDIIRPFWIFYSLFATLILVMPPLYYALLLSTSTMDRAWNNADSKAIAVYGILNSLTVAVCFIRSRDVMTHAEAERFWREVDRAGASLQVSDPQAKQQTASP